MAAAQTTSFVPFPSQGSSSTTHLDAWLRAQEKKDLVRFVTIGSVDDGKSTLIGRLLHDAHGLYQDQLDAVKRASLRGSTRGAGSSSEIDFSLFTDGLLAEREQGITIDVAYRYFATDKRKFIIADTPGHVQYTRNMATGASTADIAVILVDARVGVLPQTRRHAHIAALLGIPHVIACVNKMDLVDFQQGDFDAIAKELASIASRLGIKELHPIPVSALAGDNVVAPSTQMPWWTGGTLLDHLETLSPPLATSEGASFRLPVQLVLRPHLGYRGFAGQIVTGSIKTGDDVAVLPSGKLTRVVGVDVAGVDVGAASAPMSVALRLADEIDVSRGDMIVLSSAPLPRVEADFEADVVWMSERMLDKHKTYLLKHTTKTVRATLDIVHGTTPETLEPITTDTLGLNDIGRVIVRCRAPLFFDSYATNRATGAFVLIDSVTNDTVAAGMIAAKASASTSASSSNPDPQRKEQRRAARGGSQVSKHERRERLGQSGGVIAVLGRSSEEAHDLAFAIERELFDLGRIATVLERHGASQDRVSEEREAAEAAARGGLIALVPTIGSTVALEIAGQRIVATTTTSSSLDGAARQFADALIDRDAEPPPSSRQEK